MKMIGETFNFIRGYRDEEGNLHTDFEIREMNGTDEEAMSRPVIKSNGAKVVRTLLERCCLRIGTLYREDIKPNKWQEIIQSLAIGDQDIMLLRLRQISLGEEIHTQYHCPDENCKTKIDVYVHVDELKINEYKGIDLIDFELPKGSMLDDGTVIKRGKLRYPNGFDREVLDGIVRKNVGQANTLMLTRCITELEGTKVHGDFVRNLSMKDRNYLNDLLKEHQFGIDLNVEVECPECCETFNASLNAINFI